MFSLLHRMHLAVLTPLPPSHHMINCSSCITLRYYRNDIMTNKVHSTENVARGEMTTRRYVYERRCNQYLKSNKKSDVLDYFGTASGSWILKIQNWIIFYWLIKSNWRFYPASRYQIVMWPGVKCLQQAI